MNNNNHKKNKLELNKKHSNDQGVFDTGQT